MMSMEHRNSSVGFDIVKACPAGELAELMAARQFTKAIDAVEVIRVLTQHPGEVSEKEQLVAGGVKKAVTDTSW